MFDVTARDKTMGIRYTSSMMLNKINPPEVESYWLESFEYFQFVRTNENSTKVPKVFKRTNE